MYLPGVSRLVEVYRSGLLSLSLALVVYKDVHREQREVFRIPLIPYEEDLQALRELNWMMKALWKYCKKGLVKNSHVQR